MRPDIDASAIADGAVGIIVSLLMAVIQLGTAAVGVYGEGIWAIFTAALDPLPD